MEDTNLSVNELYSNLDSLIEEFKENHLKWSAKGNKAAAARARKAAGDIKKLVTPYRAASVEAEKAAAASK